MPGPAELALKGIVLAIADGISPSPVSQIAAETCVKALMTDYYATSGAETVRTAAARVIAATNSWLYAQNHRARLRDPDHGQICTLAALIIKGRRAHLFHVGDSRIWRLNGGTLEPLTEDHSIIMPGAPGMLSRAMGAAAGVEIDYRAVDIAPGDLFLLTTDGVHDVWNPRQAANLLHRPGDLDAAAQEIVDQALAAGSADNLTVQILRIDRVPGNAVPDLLDGAMHLPIIDPPAPGRRIDGYHIIRSLQQNARSHVFLASDEEGWRVVLKFPAQEMRADSDHLRRMMMEEWVARRLSSAHLLSAPPLRMRSAFYTVTDFVPGQSLRQWMHDNPDPDLNQLRDIIGQVALALRAMHRREMLHQDLRPENILIDDNGTVTLIDFGSAYIAGVQEAAPMAPDPVLGTVQYTAPEYFTGEAVDWRADLFSLGVITYEMLTGALPYGRSVSQLRRPRDRARLRYRPAMAMRGGRPIADWIDGAVQRACHPDARRRHDAVGEFIADLRRPADGWQARYRRPLMARDPLRFWQGLTALLALIIFILLAVDLV